MRLCVSPIFHQDLHRSCLAAYLRVLDPGRNVWRIWSMIRGAVPGSSRVHPVGTSDHKICQASVPPRTSIEDQPCGRLAPAKLFSLMSHVPARPVLQSTPSSAEGLVPVPTLPSSVAERAKRPLDLAVEWGTRAWLEQLGDTSRRSPAPVGLRIYVWSSIPAASARIVPRYSQR